ncbi:MAG: thiamine phosphate synthase [Acidobacteriota bacterium]
MKPLLYLITDRQLLPQKKSNSTLDHLIEFIAGAFAAGVDLAQIRERDLSTRELFFLTERVANLARNYQTQVLVNDRADVAAACNVGVHLTTRSMPAQVVRQTFGDALLIGVSTHTLAEAREAEAGGANFVVFGPVFDTPSKRAYGLPVGVSALQEVCKEVQIPVLALGGIKLENYEQTLQAGAAGIAAISLFTEAEDLFNLTGRIKGSGRLYERDDHSRV